MGALSFGSNYICRMKNFICAVFVCLSFMSFSFAQTTQTLGLDNYNEGTETLYVSPNGGYAFGVNGYDDLVKAQAFSHDNSFVLRNVQMKFGAVEFESTDSSSSVIVNVYRCNEAGITISGLVDSIAPGSVLASDTIPVYELEDGGALTTVNFTGEAIVIYPGELFAVGLDVSKLVVGDTVGLFSTTDGDAEETGNAWELTSDSNWVAIAQQAFSWNLDVDLAIFVGIDEDDPAGILDEAKSFYSLYPNPANNQLNVVFDQAINPSSTLVRVYNMLGELVDSSVEKNTNRAVVDVSTLVEGSYFIQISDKQSVSSRKFIKL